MNDWKEQAHLLNKDKVSWREIAKRLGVPKSTVSDFLRGHGKLVVHKPVGAKILTIDIETAPTIGYIWGRFKQFLSQEQILAESFILSYAYSWNGGEVVGEILTPQEINEENDYRLLDRLFALLNEADIVVGQNSKRFDVKIINTRLLVYGFPPPTSFKQIDTLEIAKRMFRFPSNKLGSVAKYLGLEDKGETGGFQLWADVMKGDVFAAEAMLEYNKQDVKVTWDYYQRIRSWDNKAVNQQLYYADNSPRCLKCGSSHLSPTENVAYTPQGAYNEFRCNHCGGLSRAKTNLIGKTKRQSMFVNIV
jgi:transposase-like protein